MPDICNNYSGGGGTPLLVTGSFDPEYCYDNPLGFFTKVIEALDIRTPENMAGVLIGDATPPPEDQDKLWLKTEPNCEPIGFFLFFNGAWRLAERHGVRPGVIVHYWDATLDAMDHVENARKITYLDVYEATYTAGIEYTDPFWRVCDGTHGTPDLRGRTLIGAGHEPSMPDRLWGAMLGAVNVILEAAHLPTFQVKIGPAGGTGALVPGGPEASTFEINPGGGNAHENMQPSLVAYAIMRTARRI